MKHSEIFIIDEQLLTPYYQPQLSQIDTEKFRMKMSNFQPQATQSNTVDTQSNTVKFRMKASNFGLPTLSLNYHRFTQIDTEKFRMKTSNFQPQATQSNTVDTQSNTVEFRMKKSEW